MTNTRRILAAAGTIAFLATLVYAQAASANNPSPSFIVCSPGERAIVKAPLGTDRLEFWCPGASRPALTFHGCVKPRVTRNGDTYTVSCSSWIDYDVVKR